MKHIVNAVYKNSRLLYYIDNLSAFAVPRAIYHKRLDVLLREPSSEALARAEYYNKLDAPFQLAPEAAPLPFNVFRGQRNYRMDLFRYVRYFERNVRLQYQFGDVTQVPPTPTILKARPIAGDHRNAVLFNLNKVRHFVFVKDRLRFEDKLDKLVWRGHAHQPRRKMFLERYFDHPRCDVGHAHRRKKDNPWNRPYLNVHDQLKYKFVLSIEGNDVATNLKWIMSSHSLCFMTRPRIETWYMEGRLEAGRHYVEVKDDYSDLEEKMDHYLTHPHEAQFIIRNANRHVEQFLDPRTEDIASLLVLKKYFELSGQL